MNTTTQDFEPVAQEGDFERVAQGSETARRVLMHAGASLLSMGYIVVRILMNRGKLQVMIEKDNASPLTMSDCENVSNTLSLLIDHEEWIADYTELEVSSPGTSRPLTRFCDFKRFEGSPITLKTHRPLQSGGRTLTGTLTGTRENTLLIKASPSLTRKKNTPSPLVPVTLAASFLNKDPQHLSSDVTEPPKNTPPDIWHVEFSHITSIHLVGNENPHLHDKGVHLTKASWHKECQEYADTIIA